jgi:integral membrane sensor domain MASE1
LACCLGAFVLEPELESRYVDPMGKYSRIGSIVLCLAAAGLSALAFRVSPYKSFLPLLFLPIIVFVAVRFGSAPGILGTIGAAALFAEFLFEPTSSWRVDDSVQRSNLIWMVIIGIAASEIGGARPKNGGTKKTSTL